MLTLLSVSAGEGDGEAAGSHGNRPFPPILPAPHAPGSSGPPSTDLPASSLPLLHFHLLLRLLFRGPAGAAPSQPRPPAASLQTQHLLQPHLQPAVALQLHLPGRAGRHASSNPAQRPRLLSAGLPLLLSPPTGAAALLLPRGAASSSPLGLSTAGVWTPGPSPLLQLVSLLPASSGITFLTVHSSRLLLLVWLLIGSSRLPWGAWPVLADWRPPELCSRPAAWSASLSGKVCSSYQTLYNVVHSIIQGHFFKESLGQSYIGLFFYSKVK